MEEIKESEKNDVLILTEVDTSFESNYIPLREKENRLVTDAELRLLPNALKTNPHYKEWQMRQKSCNRFLDYLKTVNHLEDVLDLGCGNGWFANNIIEAKPTCYVLGVDINMTELEQAARVFKSDEIDFAYGNVFQLDDSYKESFDLISLNGSVQYFQSLETLLNLLISFLRPNGEIHIFDSPFYTSKDVATAQKRSHTYYKNIGFEEMSKNYFHHDLKVLQDAEFLYRPKRSFIDRVLGRRDSPFPWVRIKKPKY